MVALIDTMVLSYLAEALSGSYDPTQDTDDALRPEREAAARLWMWAVLGVGETAVGESRRTRDRRQREAVDRLVKVQLAEYFVPEAARAALERRVTELMVHHDGANDCRVVAEAEALGAPAVVTFDKKLRKRLTPHAGLPVRYPSEHWAALEIPRGTPAVWPLREDNPLYRCAWWRW